MARAIDVLDAARSQIGYYAPEDPETGSRFGRWMARETGEGWLAGPSTDIWWCCCFVSWCLDQAGQVCAGFPSYNTDMVLAAGPELVYREDAMPGDIVIWNWDGNATTDHIGIVESHEPGALGGLVTIEGNYRNAVCRVDRSDSWGLVAAVIRPGYSATAEPSGDEGSAEVRELQRAVSDRLAAFGREGCVVDGFDGPETQRAVARLYQASCNVDYDASLDVDGIIGPATLAAIAAHPVGEGHETSGNDVWAVKAGLRLQGWDVDLSTWDWTAECTKALAGHQSWHGLDQDGVGGAATLPTLLPLARA